MLINIQQVTTLCWLLEKATALPCLEPKSLLADAEFNVIGTGGPQLIPAAIHVSLHSTPHALNTKSSARRPARVQQGLYSAQKLLNSSWI